MNDMVECACEHCSCEMEKASAIEQDGKYYCDESCANGHVDQAACGHAGCNCG